MTEPVYNPDRWRDPVSRQNQGYLREYQQEYRKQPSKRTMQRIRVPWYVTAVAGGILGISATLGVPKLIEYVKSRDRPVSCVELTASQITGKYKIAFPGLKVERGIECDFTGDRNEDLAVVASRQVNKVGMSGPYTATETGFYFFTKKGGNMVLSYWQEPLEIRLDEFLAEDLTGDGIRDIVMKYLVWDDPPFDIVKVIGNSGGVMKPLLDIDYNGISYIDPGKKEIVLLTHSDVGNQNRELAKEHVPTPLRVMKGFYSIKPRLVAFKWDGRSFSRDAEFESYVKRASDNVIAVMNQRNSGVSQERVQRELMALFNTNNLDFNKLITAYALGQNQIPAGDAIVKINSVEDLAFFGVQRFIYHLDQQLKAQERERYERSGTSQPQQNITDRSFEVRRGDQIHSFPSQQEAENFARQQRDSYEREQQQKRCESAAPPEGTPDPLGIGSALRQAAGCE